MKGHVGTLQPVMLDDRERTRLADTCDARSASPVRQVSEVALESDVRNVD